MDLKQKIKQLPTVPGIYLMKDSLGNIIYVGKAKNLKNRVSQYFQKSKAHAPKILKMIQNINDFDIIVTDTELEAFLMECKHIKDIKPMYNSQMKNDKGYSYIKICLGDKFPRMSVASEISEDKAEYFGPYTSLHKVEQTVAYLKDYYKLRKCTTGTVNKRNSGCLNFELGLCLGICCCPEKKTEYDKAVQDIMAFFRLYDDSPLFDLQMKMKEAAEKFDFEKAAKYRDYLDGVKHILNKQRLIRSSQYDRNIIAVEFIENATAKVFFIKGNKMLAVETLTFESNEGSIIEKSLTELAEVYFDGKNIQNTERLGQKDIDEAQIIYSYLGRKKGSILSFWIPSNWIAKEKEKLGQGIAKLIRKVTLNRSELKDEEGE